MKQGLTKKQLSVLAKSGKVKVTPVRIDYRTPWPLTARGKVLWWTSADAEYACYRDPSKKATKGNVVIYCRAGE